MKQYLLGGIEPGLFLACLLMAMVGVFVVLLLGTNLRDPKSMSSPIRFSWSYLLSDNFKRLVGNFLLIVIALRFMPEIFSMDLTPWKGLLVGIGSDSLALFIKQKTSLLDPVKK